MTIHILKIGLAIGDYLYHAMWAISDALVSFLDSRPLSIPYCGSDQGLDEAMQKGWTVVDMEKDWKTIYPN